MLGSILDIVTENYRYEKLFCCAVLLCVFVLQGQLVGETLYLLCPVTFPYVITVFSSSFAEGGSCEVPCPSHVL